MNFFQIPFIIQIFTSLLIWHSTSVIHWSSLTVWVWFWALWSILLVVLFILLRRPHRLDHLSFILSPGGWQSKTFLSTLSLKFQNLYQIIGKTLLGFSLESGGQTEEKWKIAIFIVSCFPAQKGSISFHLFHSLFNTS